MNISNIIVTTLSPFYEDTIFELTAMDGVTISYCDEESSQIIVTLEAENTRQEMGKIQRIKSLPYVLMVEMVAHYHLENAA